MNRKAESQFTNGAELKPSRRKKIFIILMILIIQAIFSYLLIVVFFEPPSSSGNGDSLLAMFEKKVSGEFKKTGEIGEIYLIEDLVINPAGTRGRRFVSLSIGLELNEGKKVAEIVKRKPKLCDAIISLLTKKSFYEFTSISNREKIRKQILHVVLQNTPPGMVNQIYITKFIIQ